MTRTTRTVVFAAVLALAVCTGVALGSAATTTTTTDEQTNETATVSISDQQIDGESVTIDSATLPDGGFAVVYDEGNDRIGHTDHLESGDHENLTVSLNQTVEDAQVVVVTLYRNNGTETFNASEDSEAYQTDSGADVSDVAYVYFEDQSRDATDSGASGDDETTAATTDEADDATDEPADETTEDAAADESGDETTDESSGGVPGFTPITAVVALLAAALVASRRC